MIEGVFIERNSPEFRRLIYERLCQVITGLRDGLYTFNDLYYNVVSLVALGDLDEASAMKVLRSPSLVTLGEVFEIKEAKKIETSLGSITLPSETPTLIVVPRREDAVPILEKYGFLVPVEKFSTSIEYGVVSVFKAISILVQYGSKVKNIVLILPENVRELVEKPNKVFKAFVALLLIARIWNVPVISPVVLRFDYEVNDLTSQVAESSRLRMFLNVLGRLSRNMIMIKTPINLDDFIPAIVKALYNKHGITNVDYVADLDIKELDPEFYETLRKTVGEVPRTVSLREWYIYGTVKRELDQDRYQKAKILGFPEKLARKIAQWKVESIHDIVKLLRDLEYDYRDKKYFKEVIIRKIAEIFNQQVEILEKLYYQSK